MTAQTSRVIGAITPPLLESAIGDLLERIVAQHAEREALVGCPSGRRWTYRELDRDVNAVAQGLLELGVVKADRVGLLGDDLPGVDPCAARYGENGRCAGEHQPVPPDARADVRARSV